VTAANNTTPAENSSKKPVMVSSKKKSVPEGLWIKCPGCGNVLYNKALQENFSVCLKCDYHFIIGAKDRIAQLIDPQTFRELDAGLQSADPLNFKGSKSYLDKVKQDQKRTELVDAVIVGYGKLSGVDVALASTDSRFIMGSMGSVVGEKITRLIESATQKKIPLIIVSGSGGGARMYEGALSLMQMAKTSAALALYAKTRMPYISVLTNPTMGGVMASFASLGDFIIAEPRALIGFAGPRVIEQTIRQKLPADFQTSEFLLKHGMIDLVTDRKELKPTIHRLIQLCVGGENGPRLAKRRLETV